MINVCLASRGRPWLLNRALRHADARVTNPDDVVFCVALDDDDATLMQPPPLRSYLIWDVAKREDTLGAKYNRCARLSHADLYLTMSDDMLLDDHGWDEACRSALGVFKDNAGVFYVGKDPKSTMPGHILATRKWLDIAGEFFCEHFPYWFLDPWLHEVVTLSARLAECPRQFRSRAMSEKGNKTRGLRDVMFWQRFFNQTRCLREAQADRIIAQLYPPNHLMRQKLAAWRPELVRDLASGDDFLLDPEQARLVERTYAEDAPEDERYRRVKQRAEHLLSTLQARAA